LTLSSANGIVSPFREIMEALLPSRQRARWALNQNSKKV
jgi:hypothetical protein